LGAVVTVSGVDVRFDPILRLEFCNERPPGRIFLFRIKEVRGDGAFGSRPGSFGIVLLDYAIEPKELGLDTGGSKLRRRGSGISGIPPEHHRVGIRLLDHGELCGE